MKKQYQINTTKHQFPFYSFPLVADDVNAYEIVLTAPEDIGNCSFEVTAFRADGSKLLGLGACSGKKATYVMANEMHAVVGNLTVRTSVIAPDGSCLTTNELLFTVVKPNGADATAAGNNTSVLTQILVTVSNMNQELSEKIIESKREAVAEAAKYTDEQIATFEQVEVVTEPVNDPKKAASTALVMALHMGINEITDRLENDVDDLEHKIYSGDNEVRMDIGSANQQTLADAKAYTDTKTAVVLEDAKAYTDDEIGELLVSRTIGNIAPNEEVFMDYYIDGVTPHMIRFVCEAPTDAYRAITILSEGGFSSFVFPENIPQGATVCFDWRKKYAYYSYNGFAQYFEVDEDFWAQYEYLPYAFTFVTDSDLGLSDVELTSLGYNVGASITASMFVLKEHTDKSIQQAILDSWEVAV